MTPDGAGRRTLSGITALTTMLTPPGVNRAGDVGVSRSTGVEVPQPSSQWWRAGRHELVERVHELLTPPLLPIRARLVLLRGHPSAGLSALALGILHTARLPPGTARLYGDLAAHRDTGQVVVGFLRTLGIADHVIPADHDAVLALWRRITTTRPVVVVLDGLRTAAEARDVRPTCGALLATLTTTASMQTGAEPGLSSRIGRLRALGAHLLDVPPLPADTARRIVTAIGRAHRRSLASEDIERVLHVSKGLLEPLLLHATHLARHPRGGLGMLSSAEDPITATTIRSLSLLEIPVRDVVCQLGAIPGITVTASSVAALTASDDPHTLLHHLHGMGLLEPAGRGRWRPTRGLLAHAQRRTPTRVLAGGTVLDALVGFSLAHLAALTTTGLRASSCGGADQVDVEAAGAVSWTVAELPALIALMRQLVATSGYPHLDRDTRTRYLTAGIDLADALAPFWQQHPRVHEWAVVEHLAITAATSAPHPPGEARAQQRLGALHLRTGRPTVAATAFTRAHTLWQDLGDTTNALACGLGRAEALRRSGHSDQALTLLTALRPHAVTATDRGLIGFEAGLCRHLLGQHCAAIGLLHDAHNQLADQPLPRSLAILAEHQARLATGTTSIDSADIDAVAALMREHRSYQGIAEVLATQALHAHHTAPATSAPLLTAAADAFHALHQPGRATELRALLPESRTL
ncbi:hypothetical protein GCM10022247_35630 [Allokutzneria multivorans]|uniref:Uncharacterized protein n=1 Tax=Allokutzneria multivorans TaxID=1142134 RepID=A0ABP7SDG5_9PSEU